MGYFSNETEWGMYQEAYCDKCVHMHPEQGCPCLKAHSLWNYEEFSKEDSVLHKMIPLDEDDNNTKCIFFWREP